MNWTTHGVRIEILTAKSTVAEKISSFFGMPIHKVWVDFSPEAWNKGYHIQIEEWLRERGIEPVEYYDPASAYVWYAYMNQQQAFEFKIRWVG